MVLGTSWLGRLLSRGLGASVRRNRRFSFVEISSTPFARSSAKVSTISADEDELIVEDKDGTVSDFHNNVEVHCSSFENLGNKACGHLPVTFTDVSTAAYRIRDGIIRTKCTKSYPLSDLCGMEVYLKQEFMQVTGSFKERGARNALLLLSEEQKKRGVISASAGNHALALTYHASLMNIPVTVIMPTIAPLNKVESTKKYGANVKQFGMHLLESKEYAVSHHEFNGMTYINGYDDPEIIAGAGSMGVEIMEQVPDLDALVVPVGGGGLIAGLGLAVKTLHPNSKVFGVEPKFCPSFTAAMEAGEPVDAGAVPTLADGLAVSKVGAHAFEVARHFVDDISIVNERLIALSVLRLLEIEKCVVEGGGGIGIASVLPGGPLHNHPDLKGKKVVFPLCGGNIDVPVLGRVIDRGLAVDNRLARFVVSVSDRPGGIHRLTRILFDNGASIRDMYHERAFLHSHVDRVQIKCVIEMTGLSHQQNLDTKLRESGLNPIWGKDPEESPPL